MISTDLDEEFLLISQQGLERKLNLVFPHSRLVVGREDLPNASHPILTSFIVKKTKNNTPPWKDICWTVAFLLKKYFVMLKYHYPM